jgi:DNA-binding transcriptional MerR regulator
MEQALLSIGKVSALYGVSVQTLRHYEKIGLFAPTAVNHETGYRYYDVDQLPRLEFILFFKRLQLSLPQIREILAQMDRGDAGEDAVFESLERERKRLDRRVEELQSLRRMLDNYFEVRQRPPARLEEIHLKEFPPRCFPMVDIEPVERESPRFAVAQLYGRQQLLEQLGPVAVDQAFGAVGSLGHFRRTGQVRYDRLLLDPMPFQGGGADGQSGVPLADGVYLAVRFRRSQTTVAQMYQLLLAFADEHRFRTDDAVLEIEMDPLFAGIARQADQVELQVHVTF